MKSHSLFRTVTVRPSVPFVVDVTANNFYLESSTDKVGVAFNEQGAFQMDSGKTVELPDGDKFHKITFTNPTTTDIVLTFYAGSLRIGTRTPYVYVRPAPTYIVPSNPTIASAATVTIPQYNLRAGQVQPDRLSRVIIGIPNAGNDGLRVFMSAVECGEILHGQTWQVQASEAITIKAVFGVSVTTFIMAFYDLPS